ncbi:CoF synthetase [Streptomyces aureoverticillatus]|uniref:CoF synthetase n=1 Tax=Streptomyces aureoverticillatus TaxID=66871 RepID=UPI0013DC0B1D|nr:CoF synthetase [Streptomyces aureoverticillatus]QIB42670.1 CoF synthetase [Streptomyces aureoverticillatus]
MITYRSAASPQQGSDHSPDLLRLAEDHARRFPWYGRLLDASGARETGALHDFPVIDDEVLTRHYYTAAHDDLPDAFAFLTSGTSSGRRKRILYSQADEDAYAAQRKALFQDFTRGLSVGSVAVADLGTGHAADAARRIFVDMGFEAHDIDFQRPLEEHVTLLNYWQPDVLFTMPMILDRLMQSPDRLHISPRKIMVVGDLATANWRRIVARHFGIAVTDVLDVFGSIEVGAIAHLCADTGLYHFHDHILPEVIHPAELYADETASASVTTGTDSGALLLTSFTRSYFPALRYVTGDLISGLCVIEYQGRRVHAFERIDGRLGGDFKHGERVSSHDICQAMATVFPGAAFEVSDDDGLVIRVVAHEILDDQLAAVRKLLMEAAPDVSQMITSGMVGEIGVKAIAADELKSTHAKRRFNVKER